MGGNEKVKQTRIGVFETNSSSVHSICIANDMPDMERYRGSALHVHGDDYGWHAQALCDPQARMSYMYTAFMSRFTFDEVKARLTKVFERYGVILNFETPPYWRSDYSNTDYYEFNIDHDYELKDFIDATWNDADTMVSFVFGLKSFVHTGNDNDDWDDYPEGWYDQADGTTKYEKGN